MLQAWKLLEKVCCRGETAFLQSYQPKCASVILGKSSKSLLYDSNTL